MDEVKLRKIAAVITDILGDRVIIGQSELLHALNSHFENLPVDIFLELIERILKDPTLVFEEKTTHCYHLFYRLENGKFLVAVIKKSNTGVYFSTLYPTGKSIRAKHKKLRKLSL